MFLRTLFYKGTEVTEGTVVIHKARGIGSTVRMLCYSHFGVILKAYKEGLVRSFHRLDDVYATSLGDSGHLKWCSLHAPHGLMVP